MFSSCISERRLAARSAHPGGALREAMVLLLDLRLRRAREHLRGSVAPPDEQVHEVVAIRASEHSCRSIRRDVDDVPDRPRLADRQGLPGLPPIRRGQRLARPVGVITGPDDALYFTSDSHTEGLFRLRPAVPISN